MSQSPPNPSQPNPSEHLSMLLPMMISSRAAEHKLKRHYHNCLCFITYLPWRVHGGHTDRLKAQVLGAPTSSSWQPENLTKHGSRTRFCRLSQLHKNMKKEKEKRHHNH